jgi:hypothetical protein
MLKKIQFTLRLIVSPVIFIMMFGGMGVFALGPLSMLLGIGILLGKLLGIESEDTPSTKDALFFTFAWFIGPAFTCYEFVKYGKLFED